jgi:mRNA interferase MazF
VDPLRGEVWEARLPRIGDHRVVVLTINALSPRLSAVTVALITGNEGPRSTHVPVDGDSGLTGYDISYVDATDLPTVDNPRLHRRRGLLSPGEIAALEDAIRLYLGL